MLQGQWERPWHLKGCWFLSGGTFCKTVICSITVPRDNSPCPFSGFLAFLSRIPSTELEHFGEAQDAHLSPQLSRRFGSCARAICLISPLAASPHAQRRNRARFRPRHCHKSFAAHLQRAAKNRRAPGN